MKQRVQVLTIVLVLAAVLLGACGSTAAPTPAPGDAVVHGKAVVEEIEILILESFPVQIHVVARGYLPNGCTKIDEILEERSGNNFQVTITTFRSTETACTEALEPFEEVIALDVVGLAAGTYQVDVNGATGSFELAMDNVPQTEPES
jgi:inhibitor of cysteine peptidase